MWYLIQQYALWLLAALALGLAIGWLTAERGATRWLGGWVPLGVIAFAAALLLALARQVKGVPGLWLDSALLFFVFYIAGCLLAGWLKTVMDTQARPATGASGSSPTMNPAMPATMPTLADEADHAGIRPLGLVAAREGSPDDLKLISGIGRQNEGRLHGLGIWHFHQIAAWTDDNIAWVGSYLAFPGRIEREDWVGQAARLATGQETDFARRARAGLVATSRDDGDAGQGNLIDPGKA
jgi:predicted flap endonuclease-1-like 5' DNA nuclease